MAMYAPTMQIPAEETEPDVEGADWLYPPPLAGEEDADYRRDYPRRTEHEWVDEAVYTRDAEDDRCEEHRRDVVVAKRLEEVAPPTRAVADVVADLIRDHGGVPWGRPRVSYCSTFPTRSAPMSAAFVNIPPPSCAKRAVRLEPKP